MAELKPCPFCGRTPIVDDCGDHRYFVRCKCGIVQDKLYAQKCDATRRWNTRKIDKDTNVPSNDCISRQAVLDIAFKYCPDDDGLCSEAGSDLRNMLDEIENLPPAQPERTCVNCGRTANNGGWYADGRTRCPIEEHYALPKDGFCHLWEKRNVTDDDYPERMKE